MSRGRLYLKPGIYGLLLTLHILRIDSVWVEAKTQRDVAATRLHFMIRTQDFTATSAGLLYNNVDRPVPGGCLTHNLLLLSTQYTVCLPCAVRISSFTLWMEPSAFHAVVKSASFWLLVGFREQETFSWCLKLLRSRTVITTSC